MQLTRSRARLVLVKARYKCFVVLYCILFAYINYMYIHIYIHITTGNGQFPPGHFPPRTLPPNRFPPGNQNLQNFMLFFAGKSSYNEHQSLWSKSCSNNAYLLGCLRFVWQKCISLIHCRKCVCSFLRMSSAIMVEKSTTVSF